VSGLTLDAGGLIAFERNDRQVIALVASALKLGVRLAVPAGVVGQVWRDGRKQARLARLLESRVIEIEPLDDRRARAAGQLCGVTGTSDVIDASVVLCAQAADKASLPPMWPIFVASRRQSASSPCENTVGLSGFPENTRRYEPLGAACAAASCRRVSVT